MPPASGAPPASERRAWKANLDGVGTCENAEDVSSARAARARRVRIGGVPFVPRGAARPRAPSPESAVSSAAMAPRRVLRSPAVGLLAVLLACATRPREDAAPRALDASPGEALAPEQCLDVVQYTIELATRFETKTVSLHVAIDAFTLRATNELALHFSGPD